MDSFLSWSASILRDRTSGFFSSGHVIPLNLTTSSLKEEEEEEKGNEFVKIISQTIISLLRG